MRYAFHFFSTFFGIPTVNHILFALLWVVSSKVNLYKSLHTKLADERSSLDHRATELRGASQALVRDSGNIGGGLDSNNLDVLIY